MEDTFIHKQEQRQQILEQRRQLSHHFQQTASHAICQRLMQHPVVKQAGYIAIYCAIGGEANVFPLVQRLSKQWLLPIVEGKQMQFVRFNPDTPLTSNIYGIAEPHDKTQTVATSAIDVILLPLVGFDSVGNRLGRGAGYYDRALAFMRDNKRKNAPYLIGIAYEFQKMDNIATDPWDVPLHDVITEAKSYRYQND